MRQRLVHLLAVAGFASIFTINSFGNFFVWNDWTLVIENFLIKDWWNLPEIFTSAFWKPLVGEPSQVYRPLVLLSFMGDFALWGLNPWGYHLTNTSLHVLNSVLVYLLMSNYVSPTTALMGSILFAAHPIHIEAVTYISGRGELLMSFFLLSGTLLFLRSAKQGAKSLYLASLPLFFFSMLAKETAAIFPLFLVAADLTAYPASARRDVLARQIGPLAVLGLYFVLRKFFAGITLSAYASSPPDFFSHLLTVLKAAPLYLGLLLFPLKLHFLHRIDTSPLAGELFLSLFLLMIARWGLRRAVRSGNRGVAFAILWFLIGLLPLVRFAGLNLPLLEGWIYLASLGFFLSVALALSCLRGWFPSQFHFWLTVLIAVLLGGMTLKRNEDWKDELRISLHTIGASPDDPVALRLLGNARFRRARTDEAEQIFQKALLLASEEPRLHQSLGQLYSFLGRDSEALDRYQRMRELTPKDPYPYWRIGRYHWRRKNFAEAERYLAEAVRLFPTSSEIRNDLANVYYFQGKLDAARAELEAALRISPYSPVLRSNLNGVLQRKPSSSFPLSPQ